jgi:hypothetical protein
VDDQNDLIPFHPPQGHSSHEIPYNPSNRSYPPSAEEIEKREQAKLKAGRNPLSTPPLPSTPSSIVGVTNSTREEAINSALRGSHSDHRQGTGRTFDSLPQVLMDFNANLTSSAEQSSLISSYSKFSATPQTFRTGNQQVEPF